MTQSTALRQYVGLRWHHQKMDVFDAADLRGLLPKRLLRWIGIAVLAFALLAPTRFQDWYLGQVQHRGERLTEQFVEIMIPSPDPSTSPADSEDTR